MQLNQKHLRRLTFVTTWFISSYMAANHCGCHKAILYINAYRTISYCVEQHRRISKHWHIVFCWFTSFSSVFLCLPNVSYFPTSITICPTSWGWIGFWEMMTRSDWAIEASLIQWTASACAVSHCWWRCKHSDAAVAWPMQITDWCCICGRVRETLYSRPQLHMQSHKQKTREDCSSEVQWQGKVQFLLHTMVREQQFVNRF